MGNLSVFQRIMQAEKHGKDLHLDQKDVAVLANRPEIQTEAGADTVLQAVYRPETKEALQRSGRIEALGGDDSGYAVEFNGRVIRFRASRAKWQPRYEYFMSAVAGRADAIGLVAELVVEDEPTGEGATPCTT